MQTTVTPATPENEELVGQIVAADESLRMSFAGLPLDEIVPEVQRSLTEIGLDLPAATIDDYARHIADRSDFELVLP